MTVIAERLFDTVPTAIDHPPSEHLVKRARALERAQKIAPHLGGYLLRVASRSQTKAARVGLYAAGALELAIELPAVWPAILNIDFRERRFTRTMISEYPHTGGITEQTVLGLKRYLRDGTVYAYKDAVLASANVEPMYGAVELAKVTAPEAGQSDPTL